MRALVAISLVIGCGSPTPSPTPAPSPAPPPATQEPVISQDECRALSSLRKERCATDEANAYAQCDSYVDLVAKTGCRREARASYDCGLASVKGCTTAECCKSSITTCDAIDTKFTNCVNVYCKSHGNDSACAYIPE